MNKQQRCGVFIIKNMKNGKIYVASSVDMDDVMKKYKEELRTKNFHNEHLQNSWNLYGGNKFDFKILKFCKSAEDAEKEKQAKIDQTPKSLLYNEQDTKGNWIHPK